MTNQTFCGVG